MQHTQTTEQSRYAPLPHDHIYLGRNCGWLSSTPDNAAATDGTEGEADDMSAKNEDEKEEGWAALRWVAACRSRM